MVAMPSAVNVPSNVGPLQSTQFLDPQAITTPNTIHVSHVMLYAGVNYEMHIIGATEAPSQSLLNPDVGIYTSDFKHLLLQQDNTPSSVDPAFLFHVNVTGVYGVGVASTIPGGTGKYLMEIHPYGLNPITIGNLNQF